MIKILETKEELNLGFALRIEVFVKEQNVPIELELDDKYNLNGEFNLTTFLVVINVKNLFNSIRFPTKNYWWGLIIKIFDFLPYLC